MNKVEQVKALITKEIVVSGQKIKFGYSGVTSQGFSGLTVFIEGNDLVFANLGVKSKNLTSQSSK